MMLDRDDGGPGSSARRAPRVVIFASCRGGTIYLSGATEGIVGAALLFARVTSVVCGTLTVALVFGWTFYLLRHHPGQFRWSLAGAAAGLLITNPQFVNTSGLAWNHDSSEFLLVAAVVTFLAAPGSRR